MIGAGFGELVEGSLVEHAVQYYIRHRHGSTLRLLSAAFLPLCTAFGIQCIQYALSEEEC